MVTITGRSGLGKTRLALEAARTLDARHQGTAFFVSLASVSDPDLVVAAIAAQLEVSAGPGAPLTDVVVRWLHRAARVMMLDNFEHLLGAAGQLSGVLDACPDLKLLVTALASLAGRSWSVSTSLTALFSNCCTAAPY